MNSLEFIEKEIEAAIKDIEWEKTLLEKEFDLIKCGHLREIICKLTKKLQTLQQIKSELEAWYSIKQGIKLCEGKVYEDSYYEYLQFEEELFDESESEDAGERLTPIKKALEVEE